MHAWERLIRKIELFQSGGGGGAHCNCMLLLITCAIAIAIAWFRRDFPVKNLLLASQKLPQKFALQKKVQEKARSKMQCAMRNNYRVVPVRGGGKKGF